MKSPLGNAYSATINGTFKVLNPFKKVIIKTNCEVHKFIQKNALNLLDQYGYEKEYNFFRKYMIDINKGIVWADQDFKSYYHFYNPNNPQNKFGSEDNALTLAQKYYNNAISYYNNGDYSKSMFLFGAASHLVQDLTVPQHAKGTVLDNHIQFEGYIRINYKKIKNFQSENQPIILNSIDEYLNYNGFNALEIDNQYKKIKDLKTRFLLTGIKCVTLAQESSAGLMITFYQQLNSYQI